jgi:hypothetical protein
MVADGSAYGGSKEMSLLYTNAAADLSAVFAKKIVKNTVLRPFLGSFEAFFEGKVYFSSIFALSH